ncbi:MAG TPA: MFS transporter [Actinomycetota bacterium]
MRTDRRRLVLASGLSSFGDELALVALTIRVHDLTDDGFAVAALLIVGILPLVILAPFAGTLVDRTETTRTLLLVSLGQAAIALTLAFVTSLPLTLVLTFVLGAGAAIASPAVFALVPSVAGEQDVTKMNASMEVARYTGAVLGPVAAGVIASGASVTVALLVNAATFLVIGVVAATLRTRRPPVTTAAGSRERLARAGFARIRRDPILLLAVVAITVMVVFAAGDNVAEVFFADEALGAAGWGYGVLATAWMAGMVGGVMLIARRLEPTALAPAILASGVVGGLAVASASAMSLVVPAAILFVVGGAANGVENASMRNLIYHRVPERLHGRVFAAYVGLVNAMQIGATAVGGLLVAGVGPRWALLVCGVGAATVGAVGLAVFALLPERSKVPDDAPAPVATEWSAAWEPPRSVTTVPEAEPEADKDVDAAPVDEVTDVTTPARASRR